MGVTQERKLTFIMSKKNAVKTYGEHDSSGRNLTVLKAVEEEAVYYATLGINDKLLDLFADIFIQASNISFEIVLAPSEYPGQNRTTKGPLGVLWRNDADLCSSIYPMTEERLHFIDYLDINIMNSYWITSKEQDKKDSPDILDAFEDPEYIKSYYLVSLTLIFLAFFFECGECILTYNRLSDNDEREKTFVEWKALKGVMQMLLFQGSFASSSYISSRFLLVLFWMFAFLFNNWLSSFLQTTLVALKNNNNVDSLQDLIEKPSLEALFVNKAGIIEYFEELSEESDQYKMITDMVRKKRIYPYDMEVKLKSVETEVVKLVDGQTAFIGGRFHLLFMLHFLCDLKLDMLSNKNPRMHISREPVAYTVEAPMIRKSLDKGIRRRIENAYNKLFQNGISRYLLNLISPKNEFCYKPEPPDDINDVIALQISAFAKTGIIFGIGIAASILVFLLEMFYHFFIRQKQHLRNCRKSKSCCPVN